ncbi:MAG: hypothetical protein OER04_03010 [Cyclobacteriaceae bacterium]|nr:hypothetical protein [Cyclobacteriaceae bacterium]
MRAKSLIVIFILVGLSLEGWAQQLPVKELISTDELLDWPMWGKGEVGKWGDQLFLRETPGTKGVMLVSPKSYGNQIILRYHVLALTPATVLVAMLSVSDPGTSESLNIPETYGGGMTLWSQKTDNYFFAFKNASHGLTPFVRHHPAKGILAKASENVMIAGVYYEVEVGRDRNRLWLAIDGKKMFEYVDQDPPVGGHVALRIRGTAGFAAGCMIKNLQIISAN